MRIRNNRVGLPQFIIVLTEGGWRSKLMGRERLAVANFSGYERQRGTAM